MRHPKRAITRDIWTRKPKRPEQSAREMAENAWPEGTIRVRDVMARPGITFHPDTIVGTAVRTMRSRKIRHAPIVDAAGHLIGMVSDRDLRQAILEPALRDEFVELSHALTARTLKDVMTWGVITVHPETPLRQAARVLQANKIGAVPVVDHDRVVGMLAAGDVLNTLVRMLDEGVLSQPGRWGIEG